VIVQKNITENHLIWNESISKDMVVIKAYMHLTAKTKRLSDSMYASVHREIIRDGCKYQQRQGDYESWCAHISKEGCNHSCYACISNDRETIRSGVHVSAKTVRLSEMVCMYQQTENVPARD
jgi:hypothetical protein